MIEIINNFVNENSNEVLITTTIIFIIVVIIIATLVIRYKKITIKSRKGDSITFER